MHIVSVVDGVIVVVNWCVFGLDGELGLELML